MLAGVGVRTWPSVDAACAAVVRTRDRVEPEAKSQKDLGPAVQNVSGDVSCSENDSLMSDML